MSEEQDIGVLANMWREQPGMVRTMFPVGIDYPIEEGDTLITIAEKFGIPWQRVAEGAIKKFTEDGAGPSFAAGTVIRIQPPQEGWENTFAAIGVETIISMWTGAPATAAMLFPNGLPYAIQGDDTLANLGEKFGIPWEAIAEATMGTSDPKAINDWLGNNGGKKLPSGYWAFNEGQEITIPGPPDQAEPDADSMLADIGNLTGYALA